MLRAGTGLRTIVDKKQTPPIYYLDRFAGVESLPQPGMSMFRRCWTRVIRRTPVFPRSARKFLATLMGLRARSPPRRSGICGTTEKFDSNRKALFAFGRDYCRCTENAGCFTFRIERARLNETSPSDSERRSHFWIFIRFSAPPPSDLDAVRACLSYVESIATNSSWSTLPPCLTILMILSRGSVR